MLKYRLNASQYHKWLPPLDPKTFVELTYSSEGEDTVREMRRLYQSYAVVFSWVTASPPYRNGSPVFDLQWACRLSTLVIVRLVNGPRINQEALAAVRRHWRPGGRTLVVAVNTVDDLNQWTAFARYWCRPGTELIQTKVEGDGRCPESSADAWASHTVKQAKTASIR